VILVDILTIYVCAFILTQQKRLFQNYLKTIPLML